METKLKEGMVISSPSIPCGEWVIVWVKEKQPMGTVGNRRSSYENTFGLIRLNGDGTYDEKNAQITISTCDVYRNRIREDDIEIIREMKKVFI